MRLRIEDIVIKTHEARLAEYKVKIFERFGEAERFHLVLLVGGEVIEVGSYGDILNGGVGNVGTSQTADSLKHGPSSILIRSVACDAKVDEDRFDGFGAKDRTSDLIKLGIV